MADAMMKPLGEANGVSWYWAEPGQFDSPGVYYWDGNRNVLCVPYAAAPTPPVQPLSEAQHSRIEADEALMREMRENVIWAFGELNGIDVEDDNNCMKATLAALGKIDTALRKRLESSNAS